MEISQWQLQENNVNENPPAGLQIRFSGIYCDPASNLISIEEEKIELQQEDGKTILSRRSSI